MGGYLVEGMDGLDSIYWWVVMGSAGSVWFYANRMQTVETKDLRSFR